jgi:hypothetical protein
MLWSQYKLVTIRLTEFLRKQITGIPIFANQNYNFLTLQTSTFQKNPTGIFGIKNRIGIPLTMGAHKLEPKIRVPTKGCADLFMDQLTQNEQISMLGAIAMAVREGQFSRDHHEVLVEGTVQGAVSHVVQSFWAAGRQNPTKDNDRELSILLSIQI